MMRNRLYTEEQVHQVVDEVLRRLGSTAALQEPEHLDNSTSQQSSPGTKMTLSVREAAELIGISKPKMYELIHSNEIPSIHVGKKIVIARQALMDWLSEGDTNGKKAC
jgi:excisionase family DNA binding protein